MNPEIDPQASRHLVTRVQAGDRAAIDALLAHHLPRLQAWLRVRMGGGLGPRESTSDVVQSACREVLEHLDRFSYEGEAGFRCWLFKTAERKLIDKHRFHRAARRDAGREALGEGGRSDAGLDAVMGDLATPSQEAMAKEQEERIAAAVDRLSDEDRELYALFHIAGLGNAEIAAELGKTEVAVRKAKSRVLARLASMLGEA
ncbi:MAG: sigma-70 family RNA polymerase sigma factor [Planctomycetes bacterium]|nr:sigma-70 family RNA polymerase sigma factor [Planctomycetota bacterium]